MAITTLESIEEMLKSEGDAVSLVRPEIGALEAISRSEIQMQLDAAHRYPRSTTRFLKSALDMVAYSREIAESCIYTLPRGGKQLKGPSVRMAEIVASCYGNLHLGARVIDVGENEVTAQAVAWDLERNNRITIEAQRGITGKRGRYDDDMIRVTGMAAISVAFRNAVFRIVPRAYCDAIYAKAKEVAVGNAETIGQRREELLVRFGRMGVTAERVLARLEVKEVADLTPDHIETLIGIGTAVRSGDVSLDEAFPAPAPSVVPEGTPEGKRVKLPGSKKAANDVPPSGSEAP